MVRKLFGVDIRGICGRGVVVWVVGSVLIVMIGRGCNGGRWSGS